MFAKSRFNPASGIVDFWNEFRKPTPYRWPILLVSSLPIVMIVAWASDQRVVAPLDKPEVTYITSFAPDRSDEEIIDSNAANQEVQELRRARLEELAARKKQMYRDLGRATGLDVDAMEREIAEQEAREALEQEQEQGQAGPEGAEAGAEAAQRDTINAPR